jgi:hypothetical protein
LSTDSRYINRLPSTCFTARDTRAPSSIFTSALRHTLVSRFAADEYLIDFDRTGELRRNVAAQAVTDATKHEQRGLVCDLHLAGKLQRADALLAGACLPERENPNTQREPGLLENRSSANGVHLPARIAAPSVVLLATAPIKASHLVNLFAPADWANWRSAPSLVLKKCDSLPVDEQRPSTRTRWTMACFNTYSVPKPIEFRAFVPPC